MAAAMNDALQAFTAEVRLSDSELRLDRAALLIAAGEYPELDIAHWLARLDEIAARVSSRLPPAAGSREVAHALRHYLFDELGFHGNEADYYDPRNSYLNDVLSRYTGIPISLSTVFLALAWRLGLEASGVSYPRHFLVKYRDGDEEWVVDPFHGGGEVAADEFRSQMVEQGLAPEHVFNYYLAAVTRRQMLTRMLTNLKAVYLHREDIQRALRIQDYLLAVSPWSFPDIRDRGMLRGQAGDVAGALADLDTYLEHNDTADDARVIRRTVERLRAGGRLDEPG